MKVTRIICPSCKAESRIITNKDNMREYSEEIVYDICGRTRCQRWHNSPEQTLLRAIFGKGEGYTGKYKLKGGLKCAT